MRSWRSRWVWEWSNPNVFCGEARRWERENLVCTRDAGVMAADETDEIAVGSWRECSVDSTREIKASTNTEEETWSTVKKYCYSPKPWHFDTVSMYACMFQTLAGVVSHFPNKTKKWELAQDFLAIRFLNRTQTGITSIALVWVFSCLFRCDSR